MYYILIITIICILIVAAYYYVKNTGREMVSVETDKTKEIAKSTADTLNTLNNQTIKQFINDTISINKIKNIEHRLTVLEKSIDLLDSAQKPSEDSTELAPVKPINKENKSHKKKQTEEYEIK